MSILSSDDEDNGDARVYHEHEALDHSDSDNEGNNMPFLEKVAREQQAAPEPAGAAAGEAEAQNDGDMSEPDALNTSLSSAAGSELNSSVNTSLDTSLESSGGRGQRVRNAPAKFKMSNGQCLLPIGATNCVCSCH